MHRAALYTTIYPGMEPFLSQWCRAVQAQSCRDFDLWVGVDGLSADLVQDSLGRDFRLELVPMQAQDTPISLRTRAMTAMAAQYDAVIFSDSDDVPEPSYVQSALTGLETSDLVGCGLMLIDRTDQQELGYFGLLAGEDPQDFIAANNILGLSNTAWSSLTLQACLPAPADVVALDWLLATRAWGYGATIAFDPTPRVRYRQYGTNTACVVPPFSTPQILRAAKIVSDHYRLLAKEDHRFIDPKRLLIEQARTRVEKFQAVVVERPDLLKAYVRALNLLPPHRLWWLTVAHPELESLWNI